VPLDWALRTRRRCGPWNTLSVYAWCVHAEASLNDNAGNLARAASRRLWPCETGSGASSRRTIGILTSCCKCRVLDLLLSFLAPYTA
jgi:hypothetical protein